LYPNPQTLDFYCHSFDTIDSLTPSSKKAWLVNAYTFTTPKPSTIRYSLVNWYATNSADLVNGEYVPAFLRIAGFISTT